MLATRKESLSSLLVFIGWVSGQLCAAQVVYILVVSTFFKPWSLEAVWDCFQDDPNKELMLALALLSAGFLWWARELRKPAGR